MTADEHSDRGMADLGAARPSLDPPAEEWVTSDRGQRVLERVLASVETSAPARKRRAAWARGSRNAARDPGGRKRRRADYRAALAAAVFALTVVAVTLVLVFVVHDPDGAVVVQTSETTATSDSTLTPGQAVTKLSAAEHIVQLAWAVGASTGDSLGTATTDRTFLLSEAVDRGLITSAEVTGASPEPVLERQYAVMLWKAFGSAFPVASGPAVSTPADLDPEETAAVQGLLRLGVLRAADGVFSPDRPLDSEREELLLDRMQAALLGQTSD